MRIVALAAGFLVAMGVAALSASAGDASISAVSASDTWNPNTATIQVGEKITWSTDGAGFHNVCVLKPGTTGDTCTSANQEFRNGDVKQDWSGNAANGHTFTTAGTYTFFCEAHKSLGMTGTITVQGNGTGTGTSTTPPPDTQPTDTITTPTQTTPAPDTTAPAFVGKLKRKASRKSLILDFSSSEDAALKANVSRRKPGARSYTKIGEASLKVKQGHNVVTLPRRAGGALRSGSYKVNLQLVDDAGNKSATKTLTFKLTS